MRVFISGLTGTLGTSLAKMHHSRGDDVWGCSRSEVKAVEWLGWHARIATLFLTDALSLADPRSDVGRLLPTMDRVYHTAALKHVNIAEENPGEAFRQNVLLTGAVAVACKMAGVPMVFVSSDKACSGGGMGVYGASKLLAERISLREGAAVVRFGNLIGSSGSVFAIWKAAVEAGQPIKVTDRAMTRYFIDVEEAARFMADEAMPGKVVIPNPLFAIRMGDVVDTVAADRVPVVEIGRRPGETRHQWLVAPGEPCGCLPGKLVLGDGPENVTGLCSAIAPTWDVGDLLLLAGLETGEQR